MPDEVALPLPTGTFFTALLPTPGGTLVRPAGPDMGADFLKVLAGCTKDISIVSPASPLFLQHYTGGDAIYPVLQEQGCYI